MIPATAAGATMEDQVGVATGEAMAGVTAEAVGQEAFSPPRRSSLEKLSVGRTRGCLLSSGERGGPSV